MRPRPTSAIRFASPLTEAAPLGPHRFREHLGIGRHEIGRSERIHELAGHEFEPVLVGLGQRARRRQLAQVLAVEEIALFEERELGQLAPFARLEAAIALRRLDDLRRRALRQDDALPQVLEARGVIALGDRRGARPIRPRARRGPRATAPRRTRAAARRAPTSPTIPGELLPLVGERRSRRRGMRRRVGRGTGGVRSGHAERRANAERCVADGIVRTVPRQRRRDAPRDHGVAVRHRHDGADDVERLAGLAFRGRGLARWRSTRAHAAPRGGALNAAKRVTPR